MILWEWSENQGESWMSYDDKISKYLEEHCTGESVYFGVGFSVYLVNFKNMTCEKQKTKQVYILRKVVSRKEHVNKHLKNQSGKACEQNLVCTTSSSSSSSVYNSNYTQSQISVTDDPFRLSFLPPCQIINGTLTLTSGSQTLPMNSFLSNPVENTSATVIQTLGCPTLPPSHSFGSQNDNNNGPVTHRADSSTFPLGQSISATVIQTQGCPILPPSHSFGSQNENNNGPATQSADSSTFPLGQSISATVIQTQGCPTLPPSHSFGSQNDNNNGPVTHRADSSAFPLGQSISATVIQTQGCPILPPSQSFGSQNENNNGPATQSADSSTFPLGQSISATVIQTQGCPILPPSHSFGSQNENNNGPATQSADSSTLPINPSQSIFKDDSNNNRNATQTTDFPTLPFKSLPNNQNQLRNANIMPTLTSNSGAGLIYCGKNFNLSNPGVATFTTNDFPTLSASNSVLPPVEPTFTITPPVSVFSNQMAGLSTVPHPSHPSVDKHLSTTTPSLPPSGIQSQNGNSTDIASNDKGISGSGVTDPTGSTSVNHDTKKLKSGKKKIPFFRH